MADGKESGASSAVPLGDALKAGGHCGDRRNALEYLVIGINPLVGSTSDMSITPDLSEHSGRITRSLVGRATYKNHSIRCGRKCLAPFK